MVKDVIVGNKQIYDLFIKRLKASGITFKELSEEMNQQGITMDAKRLRCFVKNGTENKVTQAGYLYMLKRVGIRIVISIKDVPYVERDNKEVSGVTGGTAAV